MKTLTIRLPDALFAQIETEARARKISKSEVLRERVSNTFSARTERLPSLEDITDLIGSVEGLPSDLSARKKHYLTPTYLRRK